jgi:hypothetical protein
MNAHLEKFGVEAYKYISSIHPVNWVLFANAEDLFDNNEYN